MVGSSLRSSSLTADLGAQFSLGESSVSAKGDVSYKFSRQKRPQTITLDAKYGTSMWGMLHTHDVFLAVNVKTN